MELILITESALSNAICNENSMDFKVSLLCELEPTIKPSEMRPIFSDSVIEDIQYHMNLKRFCNLLHALNPEKQKFTMLLLFICFHVILTAIKGQLSCIPSGLCIHSNTKNELGVATTTSKQYVCNKNMQHIITYNGTDISSMFNDAFECNSECDEYVKYKVKLFDINDVNCMNEDEFVEGILPTGCQKISFKNQLIQLNSTGLTDIHLTSICSDSSITVTVHMLSEDDDYCSNDNDGFYWDTTAHFSDGCRVFEINNPLTNIPLLPSLRYQLEIQHCGYTEQLQDQSVSDHEIFGDNNSFYIFSIIMMVIPWCVLIVVGIGCVMMKKRIPNNEMNKKIITDKETLLATNDETANLVDL